MGATTSGALRRMRSVLVRLEKNYGRPRNTHRLAPLDELILTVLSQNTNDRNRDRAYHALRRRYPTWEDVLGSTDAAVARTIREGGLANQKAKRIRRILAGILEDRGALDLGFLRRWSVGRAAEYLSGFKGVGEKTVNCVLLFSLGKAAFPVDTHVHRLAIRMGFAGERADAADVHRILPGLIPERDFYAAHMNFIRHGREVCHARRADCASCVVATLCPSRSDGNGS